MRGLFSGGTLCSETQILFRDIGEIYGNAPLSKELKLEDSWKSFKHTVVDLGEDEFTIGRPHPMIDFSLRKLGKFGQITSFNRLNFGSRKSLIPLFSDRNQAA